MTTQEYALPDPDGEVTFRGTLLGSATTEDRMGDHPLRWTEVHVYRTEGGTYVVHKVGRSTVFHSRGDECGKKAVETDPLEVPDDRFFDLNPCPRCVPPTYPSPDEFRTVWVEVDRHSVSTAESASGAVECAKTRNHHEQTVFLTRVAREALAAAAVHDQEVAQALAQRRIA